MQTPKIESPQNETPQNQTPHIESQNEMQTPKIESPQNKTPQIEIQTPKIASPQIESQNEIQNPQIESQNEIQNPQIESQNPQIDSPQIDSPQIDSPQIDSPQIESQNETQKESEMQNKSPTPTTLWEEPGIPELEALYFDAGFDPKTGKFMRMSSESKKDYEKDVRIFYEVFTGKPAPDTIQSFHDIPLTKYCQDNPVKIIKDDSTLWNKYAKHLREMRYQANKNRESLTGILNQIFVYETNIQTQTHKITLSSSLTEGKLQKLVESARRIIIKLYLQCEVDYVKGIKIYEALVEAQILKTAKRQIKHLESSIHTTTHTD